MALTIPVILAEESRLTAIERLSLRFYTFPDDAVVPEGTVMGKFHSHGIHGENLTLLDKDLRPIERIQVSSCSIKIDFEGIYWTRRLVHAVGLEFLREDPRYRDQLIGAFICVYLWTPNVELAGDPPECIVEATISGDQLSGLKKREGNILLPAWVKAVYWDGCIAFIEPAEAQEEE